MASVRALTLLPLILSSIAQPVSPTPRDDPSTFIQDTSPLVDNPNAKWPMDGDEMFGDSFAIPYLYPSSSSSLPSPSPSPSVSRSPSLSASATPTTPITPIYTPWAHSAETPLSWAHSPETPLPWAYTPVNTPVNTPVSTEPVKEHPTPVKEQPVKESNSKPTDTETVNDDNNHDDSFDALWDVLSGRIKNVLNSDELTLWD